MSRQCTPGRHVGLLGACLRNDVLHMSYRLGGTAYKDHLQVANWHVSHTVCLLLNADYLKIWHKHRP